MFNTENLKYFNQPNEADNWVWRINNGVGDWIRKEGNKSLWYIVLWESKRQGILIDEITRKEFATLLAQECADALFESDTVNTVFHNIECFKYKPNLKRFDKEPEKSFVRGWVDTVSNLLTKDVITESTPDDFTLEQRMKEYLTNSTANETYAKVCIRPIYNDKIATMSVENYVSQRFWDEHRPSRIVIFECVEESLTEEKVEMLYGRFGTLSNTKLFIASTHSFGSNVKNEASRHDVGLVLVNPKYKVDENCFVLPRARASKISDELLWERMLEGKEKMTVPILAFDGQRIDDSLSFILYKYASYDKKNLFVAAPVLCDDEIESKAFQLVKPQVDFYVSLLRKCGPYDKVPVCEIDPYLLADKMGLTVNRGKTGKNLGHIDIGHRKVTLTNRLEADDPSDRFSMAHEIGHHVLHEKVSAKLEDGHHHIVSNTKKWLEHHAHHFASCLLMPAPVIKLLYAIYWKKEFKSEKVCPLLVNRDYYHDPVFQRIVGPVARKMNVSLQVAYIRLKKMGLLFHK